MRKILLDECLPKKLKREIADSDYDILTVTECGWAGTKNGKLLRLVETKFDVFITIDNNLSAQQNLKDINLGLIILSAFNNRIETLKPLTPQIKEVLGKIKTGDIIIISEK